MSSFLYQLTRHQMTTVCLSSVILSMFMKVRGLKPVVQLAQSIEPHASVMAVVDSVPGSLFPLVTLEWWKW